MTARRTYIHVSLLSLGRGSDRPPLRRRPYGSGTRKTAVLPPIKESFNQSDRPPQDSRLKSRKPKGGGRVHKLINFPFVLFGSEICSEQLHFFEAHLHPLRSSSTVVKPIDTNSGSCAGSVSSVGQRKGWSPPLCPESCFMPPSNRNPALFALYSRRRSQRADTFAKQLSLRLVARAKHHRLRRDH